MGWDALAWNYRSCSGTPNRYLRFYHSGVTEDLSCVINHALNQGRYQVIYLVDFSLGGNLTLIVSALNDPFLSPECYPVTAVLEKLKTIPPKGEGLCPAMWK